MATYSFSDIQFVLSHPAYPPFSMNGQGVGEVRISYDQDNSAHTLGADGTVMVSKIRANNGSISLSMQQTSPLHAWLKGLFNYLNTAPTNQWAAMAVDITGAFMVDNIRARGVSIQKRADQGYAQQGENVTWTLMAADIQGQGTTQATINTNVSGTII